MLSRYRDFKGSIPRRSARLLPPDAAQEVEDMILLSGEIRPIGNSRLVLTPENGANALTIERYVNSGVESWLEWTTVVNSVRGPLGDDSLNRRFYTGDGIPKKTGSDIALTAAPYPSAWYRMGVKTPVTAPALTKTVSGTGDVETRYYVYTFVTGWNEEGGPSLAGSVADVPPVGSTVEVDLSGEADPDTEFNITTVNIYRTLTGSVATDFVYVGSITWDYSTPANNKFDDDLNVEALGSALATYDFDEPPSDLAGLAKHPNSFLVGFSGNYIYFSQPGFPYAWPQKYRKVISEPPVAIGVDGAVIIVATTGRPYTFQGNHPASITPGGLMPEQSCKSAQSLRETSSGVAWATPTGLYVVPAHGAGNLFTRPFLTAKDWLLLKPETMITVVHDGRAFISYQSDDIGTRKLIVLDPLEPQQYFSTLSNDATALFADATGVYMLIDGKIYEWDADETVPLTGRYRSKREPQRRPVNKAYAQIKGDWTLESITGLNLSFAEYQALRAEILAANAALYQHPTAYLPQCFGGGTFGEHAFAGDDMITVPADIGEGVIFRLYGDDNTLRHTQTITDEEPFSLPGNYLAQEYAFETEGAIRVEEVLLADSFEDLKEQ